MKKNLLVPQFPHPQKGDRPGIQGVEALTTQHPCFTPLCPTSTAWQPLSPSARKSPACPEERKNVMLTAILGCPTLRPVAGRSLLAPDVHSKHLPSSLGCVSAGWVRKGGCTPSKPTYSLLSPKGDRGWLRCVLDVGTHFRAGLVPAFPTFTLVLIS